MVRIAGFFAALTVFAVIAAVADGWAVLAVARRSRAARLVITLVEVADVLVGLTGFSVLDVPTMVAVLVLGLPFNATLLVLLWGPASSRCWFDDRSTPGPVVDTAVSGPPCAAPYDDPTARTDVLVLPTWSPR